MPSGISLPMGFTGADVALLCSTWPAGALYRGSAAGVFAVTRRDGRPWIVVSRWRDGSYVMIDASAEVSALGRSLAELPVEQRSAKRTRL